ncbi:MAG: hypothetical protein OCU22_03560 [Canidatus Methanoxibalbensis ujae]|nr:hypothetical protein [Candidatus Methanoxibalbensis ujae]
MAEKNIKVRKTIFPQLETEPGDIIEGKISYINNNLPSGTEITIGYMFGYYKEEGFVLQAYRADSTVYVWGAVKDTGLPSPGEESSITIPSAVVIEPSESKTYGVFVCVSPKTSLITHTWTIDSSTYVVGIEENSMYNWIGNVYDSEIFTDQITVSRPVPEVEVTGFSITKS